ncbi:MAG TPA: hypothetical protein VME45_16005 [Stellaceae bacterium]|nr:hypothetical protein [Stellaceae bacterium]
MSLLGCAATEIAAQRVMRADLLPDTVRVSRIPSDIQASRIPESPFARRLMFVQAQLSLTQIKAHSRAANYRGDELS